MQNRRSKEMDTVCPMHIGYSLRRGLKMKRTMRKH